METKSRAMFPGGGGTHQAVLKALKKHLRGRLRYGWAFYATLQTVKDEFGEIRIPSYMAVDLQRCTVPISARSLGACRRWRGHVDPAIQSLAAEYLEFIRGMVEAHDREVQMLKEAEEKAEAAVLRMNLAIPAPAQSPEIEVLTNLLIRACRGLTDFERMEIVNRIARLK